MAGIDYRESLCRSSHTCRDGLTKIGDPEHGFGDNCDINETIPGAPVQVPGGCGFTDKEHALRWCTKFLLEHSEIRNGGKRFPETMEEIMRAVAGYNGYNYNANCKPDAGVDYSYCPPALDQADHTYVTNKYMCPAFPNHCNMYLLNCGSGNECPKLYQSLGALTVGRAFFQLIQQQ